MSVAVKTGPSGVGGMTLSTKMDARGLGKESRSILTLTQEARKEENEFLQAFFIDALSQYPESLVYAGWNYCDLPSLVGPHISGQSIPTHHTHFGVISTTQIDSLPKMDGTDVLSLYKKQSITDNDM